MFYDPADRDDLCLDLDALAQMADAFSRALDVDPRRLLDQAYAYGCLSASLERGWRREQRDLAIAAAIKQVRRRHTRYQATSPIPWEHINLTGEYRWPKP